MLRRRTNSLFSVPARAVATVGAAFLATAMSGCGSSSSPVQAQLGTGVVEASVGPGGRTIRGTGPLAGVILEVPAGAVQRLVRLRIEVGEPLVLSGTRAASIPLRMTADPDPGALLLPATITFPVSLPVRRSPADLLISRRVQRPGLPGRAPRVALGIAAEFGEYDQEASSFAAKIGGLADMQVLLTAEVRSIDDANALAGLAIESLGRSTDESIEVADLRLAEALRADPFFPAARVLRAVTRVLVVLNDRESRGVGLQSLGEAASAFGLDLPARSVLRRIVTGDWPSKLTPSQLAPTAADVLELLRTRLRPALMASLGDLEFVPPHGGVTITLPRAVPALAGDRQVDAADLELLRSACHFALYLIDALEDLDVAADAAFFVSPAAATATPESLLVRFPGFGGRRAEPAERTREHLFLAISALAEGFRQLNAESDPQDDDLVVFSSSFTPAKRDRWQRNLSGAVDSLRTGGSRLLQLEADALELDLGPLAAGLDWRALAPAFSGFAPLAASLPDPTLGGLFPTMTMEGSARFFRLASAFDLRPVSVVIDGEVGDWPKQSEALLPTDAIGDAGTMVGLDLERVFLGTDGDDLVCRLSLARGGFVPVPGSVAVYGFRIRPQRQRPAAGGPSVRVAIEVTSAGVEVTFQRDGQAIEVRHEVAVSGSELEIAVDRFDLFEPDEPTRCRVLRAFSMGLEKGGKVHRGDLTRRILLRF